MKLLSIAFLLTITFLSSAHASESEELRKKKNDLLERRLILVEYSNFLGDEEVHAGEFAKLMIKIDSIDKELKEYNM